MLLNRWLVVNEHDEVINIIIYDGGAWTPPSGCRLIEESPGVGIGWRLIDGEWAAPPTDEATTE